MKDEALILEVKKKKNTLITVEKIKNVHCALREAYICDSKGYSVQTEIPSCYF